MAIRSPRGKPADVRRAGSRLSCRLGRLGWRPHPGGGRPRQIVAAIAACCAPPASV